MLVGGKTRRMFLQGSGGFLLSLPFLSSISKAQTVPKRKRFVYFFNTNGSPEEHFFPSQSPTIDLGANAKALDLAQLSGPMSYILGASFDRFKSKTLLIRGLNGATHGCDGHGDNHFLSGSGGHLNSTCYPEGPKITVDWIMSESSSVYTAPPSARSIRQTAFDGYVDWACSVGMVGGKPAVLPSFGDPKDAFDQYFKGISSGVSRRQVLTAKAVNLVFEDYSRLRNSTRISQMDKQALDSHMTSLNEIESKLLTAGSNCSAPATKSLLITTDNQPERVKLMADLLAMAIKCGITNIGGISFEPNSGEKAYSCYPGVPTRPHHAFAHDATDSKNTFATRSQNTLIMALLRKYWADQIAAFLTTLDVVEDSNTGQTFLDNTVVLWGTDMNLSHHKIGIPTAVFGNWSGYFKSGRYIDFRNFQQFAGVDPSERPEFPRYAGQYYPRMLVSLLDGIGVPPSEYLRYYGGSTGFGPSDVNYDFVDTSLGNQPLPYLRS